jgi:hypothetical protein
MKDYEETLERAATAAASGDNFEAVRLYERAGRVAYNNKLVVDGVVLESKIAAASKARDAGQPTTPSSFPLRLLPFPALQGVTSNTPSFPSIQGRLAHGASNGKDSW